MAQVVSHEGIVIKITATSIEVKVSKQEACGSCRAKELCGTGSDRIILVPMFDTSEYREGQQVLVTMSESLGLQAATFVYVFPFVIILTVLLISLQLNAGELISGLLALGCGALYFVILSLFRNKFTKKIVFTAYPID